jgi:tRNA1(Val) A37 N6-methylase TrmN6
MEFIKDYPVEKLQVWEKNPRKNDEASEKLSGMIQEYGFINPIIIDQHGIIRAGHTRLKAAKKLDKKTVPVLIHNFENEAQAIGFAIADNKSSEWAEWDFGQLEELMKELEEQDFDTEMTGFDDDEKDFNVKDYTEGVTPSPLNDDFLVPPFSVLNTSRPYWIERKKMWKGLIGDSGETRKYTLGAKRNLYTQMTEGVSVLDPVLAELVNHWFLPNKKDNKILDCFAGDTVFGFVSGHKGNAFRGIELRKEQCDLNNERTKEFDVKYFNDDGQNVLKHVDEKSMDLLFSCPPYFDLEVYSKLENDASNQKNFPSFVKILENAFTDSLKCLKDNRFAVIVIGDVRNKKTGYYYDLIGEIIKIMRGNDYDIYNHIILYDRVGTAAMMARPYMKNRKLPKVHQNILVFYKGDTKKIKDFFGEVEVIENEGDDMELQTVE